MLLCHAKGILSRAFALAVPPPLLFPHPYPLALFHPSELGLSLCHYLQSSPLRLTSCAIVHPLLTNHRLELCFYPHGYFPHPFSPQSFHHHLHKLCEDKNLSVLCSAESQRVAQYVGGTQEISVGMVGLSETFGDTIHSFHRYLLSTRHPAKYRDL